MGETMRALRKTAAGAGAQLVEVPRPRPGAGEVLVRVHAASVCGTDLHILEWNDWAAERISRLPLTFGHEVAGIVADSGPEVHHLERGTFVAAESHIACGYCRTCRTGRSHVCENLRILGVDVDGAFADYVVIPATCAWAVGSGIDPGVASVMEPFGNAVHAVVATEGGGDVEASDVVVIGCGPIGLFAIAIARAAGASRVVGIDPNTYRRDLAAKMGADVVVDPAERDPVVAITELTRGHGAPVVLEMSGNARALEQGTEMLSRGGRMSLLGLPSGPVSLELADNVIFKEARLLGITGREMFRTWQQTQTLLESGMVDVGPVLTHRFDLQRFDDAFDALRSGRSGKVILVVDGDAS
jgi:threonine 3-dehydrogenase